MVIKYFKDKIYGKRRNKHSKKNENVLLSEEKTSSVYYTEPLSYEEVRANSVPLKHNPFLSRHTPNKVHEYGESTSIKHCGNTGNDSINKKEQSSRTSQIDNTFISINAVDIASNVSYERCDNSHNPNYDSYPSSNDSSSSSSCD